MSKHDITCNGMGASQSDKRCEFKSSPSMSAAVVVHATVPFTMPDAATIGVDARVLGCVEGVTSSRITS